MHGLRQWTQEALASLGKRNLLLGMQDAAFPASPNWDIGRGTPYSRASFDFLDWAAGEGFTGLQMGPQGKTTEHNPSPYDGTWFSGNPLNLDFQLLVEQGHVPSAWLWETLSRRPRASLETVDVAFAHGALRALIRHASSREVETWLSTMHDGFHRHAKTCGLQLFGDMQVGMSQEEAASHRALFLPGVFMGAPPSRTHPEGQAWNYPVFDPRLYLDASGRPGPVLALYLRRARKLAKDYDGVRIDHPHGLVDPWVYLGDEKEPLRAVQKGTRLFSSPDHPTFGALSIARPNQIDLSVPRHADGFVTHLSQAQVDRYGLLVSTLLLELAQRLGRPPEVACEVLSTLPFPLAEVLRQQGLGRFRVVAKARPDRPDDVYHPHNARPEDWIMPGNHDTPTLWQTVKGWRETKEDEKWVRHLVSSLEPNPSRRSSLAQGLLSDDSLFIHALLADMFLSRAENVMVFFADLFGMQAPYNRPGTVDPRNWTLRVPIDFSNRRERLPLRVAVSLFWALRARTMGPVRWPPEAGPPPPSIAHLPGPG